MPGNRRLRKFTALVATPLVVAGLSLAAAGTAQATGVSSQSGAPQASPVAADHDKGSKAKSKASNDRYKPAGCATLTAAQRSSPVAYATCFALGYTNKAGKLLSPNDGPPATALGPQDFQDAYNLPNGGEGKTVAIVDAFGYSNAEEDLAVFRDYYGLPPCTSENGCFTTIDQRGGTDFPPDNPGWSIEAALDMDAVSSVCPKCNILLVQADSNSFADLGKAVETASNWPGVVAISNSYGLDGENPAQDQYDHYYNQPGIAVTVSSGDTGNVQSWPATNPTVVAVGGTTLNESDSERGWHETAWGNPNGGDGAGSGCSLYEPRPAWQQDVETTCADHKATADISADADPATGLGIYNSAAAGGWAQYGGTSLAAPLVAGMYALAGTPTPETYPVSYAYANTDALFDVTEGANDSCGTKLCEAGPGWDGPTGLGTPNGVAALRQGETGQIVGTVTGSDSGDPLVGATVTATNGAGDEFSATTGEDGTYDLHAPAGTYSVTASKFGYAEKTVDGVEVTVNEQVTADFALVKQDTKTVAGYVTDGSGHGWPMRAKITVEGAPDGNVVFSDPYTGHYSLQLPEGAEYTLHAESADLPGYAEAEVTVDLTGAGLVAEAPHKKYEGQAGSITGKAAGLQAGTHHKKVKPSAAQADIALTVDSKTCTAPGYEWAYSGTGTDFEGWTDKTPQDGWSIVDNEGTGQTWAFNDPGSRGNLTGGSGNFAIVDSADYGIGNTQDTSLVSPVTDLSGMDNPVIEFDTAYKTYIDTVATVDVSLDGGETWNTVWKKTEDVQGHVKIAIPDAANKSNVQVRFHFVDTWGYWWEIDNVVIGKRSCDPVDGGLVAGIVTDQNTGQPLNGATVTSQANDEEFGVAAGTPEDANLSDGYYWLFSSHTGQTGFTVSDGNYTPAEGTVNVPPDYVEHQDWSLAAGHLTVDKHSIEVTEQMGQSKTATITFGNDGTEPVHVKLGEQDGGFTPMHGKHLAKAPGAPTKRVKGDYYVGSHLHYAKTHPKVGKQAKAGPDTMRLNGLKMQVKGHTVQLKDRTVQLRQSSPAAEPWTDIADYPTAIMDNAVAYHNGKVYSMIGYTGSADSDAAYVYDSSTQKWSQIADAPFAGEEAKAAFVGNTLYLIGGWGPSGTRTTTYAYDPASDSWTQKADMPTAVAAQGMAVLNGKIYVIGGCTTTSCTPMSSTVQVYDPASDSWSQAADYPIQVAFPSCAGISGQVVCAGGTNATSSAIVSTYLYNPGSNTWSQGADMPFDLWGSAVAGANNTLQIATGVTGGGASITNQAIQYDPATDSWTELPNANNTIYRGGGACGLYQVGGGTSGVFGAVPHPWSEVLPGYDQCGSAADVSWLGANPAEFDVAPGETVSVTVTMDAGAVSQPGGYMAKLNITTNSPYTYEPVDVTMHVNPPSTWGKIAGTVTDAAGNPLPGTTVQICTMWDRYMGCGPVTYTLKTDDNGHYQLWLNAGYNPLQLIAAKSGYLPKAQLAEIERGETTTVNFTLKKAP